MATAWTANVIDSLGMADLLTRGYMARPARSTPSGITVSLASQANDGLLVYRVLWPANTTGVNVKSIGGQVKWAHLFNGASSARFVKLYDKALAPMVGSDKPWITFGLPATSGLQIVSDDGLQFVNGLGVGVSTGIADSDTTAPSANDVLINLGYI